VNSSRVLSLLLIVGLALIVTVPLKVVDFTVAEQSLSRRLQQAIVAMLTNEGFEIKSVSVGGGVVVDAQHNDCHLQLRKVQAQGYSVDAIKMASEDARLAFAYHGVLSGSHPTLRATVSEIWSRFKWHLKIDNSWLPVVSVASKGPCFIDAMPWQRIAKIQTDNF
jgi:hypothetical protein